MGPALRCSVVHPCNSPSRQASAPAEENRPRGVDAHDEQRQSRHPGDEWTREVARRAAVAVMDRTRCAECNVARAQHREGHRAQNRIGTDQATDVPAAKGVNAAGSVVRAVERSPTPLLVSKTCRNGVRTPSLELAGSGAGVDAAMNPVTHVRTSPPSSSGMRTHRLTSPGAADDHGRCAAMQHAGRHDRTG